MTTALISLKECSECKARAPIGWTIEHESHCSGSPNVCNIVQGPWELEPGDEIIRLDIGAQS